MTHYNSQHAISRIVDGQQQQRRSGKTLRRPSPGAVRSRTTTDRARRTGLCIVGSVLEKMRNSFFYSQKFAFNYNCLAEFGAIDVPSEQWCYEKDSSKFTQIAHPIIFTPLSEPNQTPSPGPTPPCTTDLYHHHHEDRTRRTRLCVPRCGGLRETCSFICFMLCCYVCAVYQPATHKQLGQVSVSVFAYGVILKLAT